ncbi:hypothetical protein Anas_02576 [Armadillidium nasatum]|uniref:Uncharacterized protein n=1 Tax=Armadillidium nasatum TaxID=96803 RepID=A0A5N5SRH8_9CRUS|nr:hypothetical protein Anas_02576 [Armadillidium nasatum]
MALIEFTGEDSWLKEFEYIGSLISEINQAIVRRRQLRLGNIEHAGLSSQLRKQIPQAEVQLAALLRALEDPTNNLCRTVVPGERERRMRLCENLKSNLIKSSQEYYRGGSFRGPFTKVADLGNQLIGEKKRANLQEVLLMKSCEVSREKLFKWKLNDLLIDIQDRTTVTQASLEQQTSNIHRSDEEIFHLG